MSRTYEGEWAQDVSGRGARDLGRARWQSAGDAHQSPALPRSLTSVAFRRSVIAPRTGVLHVVSWWRATHSCRTHSQARLSHLACRLVRPLIVRRGAGLMLLERAAGTPLQEALYAVNEPKFDSAR